MRASDVRPNLTNCTCISGDREIYSYADLLLLHELRIRTIVNHILPKHWSCEGAVDLFCVQIFVFSIQDKIISLHTQADCGLLSQQNECENVAILEDESAPPGMYFFVVPNLLSACEEEFVWVDTVRDGTTDKWDPVEDDRRRLWVSEEQLAQHIEHNGENDESEEDGSEQYARGVCAE